MSREEIDGLMMLKELKRNHERERQYLVSRKQSSKGKASSGYGLAGESAQEIGQLQVNIDIHGATTTLS